MVFCYGLLIESGLLLWPFGKVAFWLKVVFCYGLLIESGLLLWPFGKVAFWLKVVFCYGLLVESGLCYGLLVRPSGVVVFCYSLLAPLDHTKPEGTKPEGYFQPEGHQTRRPLSTRRPPKQKTTKPEDHFQPEGH